MQVNGFRLPTAFESYCDGARDGDLPSMLIHSSSVDAFGHAWPGGDITLQCEQEAIKDLTALLQRLVLDEDRFQ